MPEEGMTFLPRGEILSVGEIIRIATVARRLGVTSVRITGGEPLVRQGIVEIVGALAQIGFEDLSMTTNGTSLTRLAQSLADAGLRRVNVSCDSLRPDVFSGIRRRGSLEPVLAAMVAAEAAGLTPVKVNVVLVPGENDGELLDFARLARETGRIVRFIEFMPLDAAGRWRPDLVVPGSRVIEEIGAVYPLGPVGDPTDPAPAVRFRFLDGIGEIGVISSVTEPFCGTCNRLRLMADGAIRNCLFSDDELSVRDTIRSGGSDEDLEMVFRRAVWGKLPGHGINEPGFLQPARSMSRIGG
jgi:cyclic pyranopterin phosphate synthase